MRNWRQPAPQQYAALLRALLHHEAIISKKLKEEIRDQKALRDGVQSLLRDRIIQCHNHYIDKGYIPVYGMENVLSMYDAYHELGGNGAVTKLVDTLKELPTDKPDREKGATI